MAELKTQPNRESVKKFLAGVSDARRRADALAVAAMMGEATGEKPVMWGDSIVGFGNHHNRYESGREGGWFLTGFSPRATSLVLYIMAGFSRYEDFLARLGKHKSGKSCLYIKRLEDVDETVLRRLIRESVAHARKTEQARTS